MVKLPVDEMTRDEKLLAIEELWTSLAQDQNQIESPQWHRAELAETDERVRSGAEKPIPWEQAKSDLLRLIK